MTSTNVKLDESILFIDEIDIDYINVHEKNAIHKQDELQTYSKVKQYMNKFPTLYNIGYYTVKFGKYIIPFL